MKLPHRRLALPELPIQYGDFAVWQRQWLTGVLDSANLLEATGWRGSPPLLELPTDRPRPLVQTFRGCSEHFHLDLTESAENPEPTVRGYPVYDSLAALALQPPGGYVVGSPLPTAT